MRIWTGGRRGGGENYSLREIALSWKGYSMPYPSWSENNFLYVPNVLMLYCVVPGYNPVTGFQT